MNAQQHSLLSARCRSTIIRKMLMAHGGGGKLMHDLIEKVFVPAFAIRCSMSGTTARSSTSATHGWRSRPTRTS